VAEHPEAFHHVGLLVNGSAGHDRDTLYLVFRLLVSDYRYLKIVLAAVTGRAA
jgi:hypothetical protein